MKRRHINSMNNEIEMKLKQVKAEITNMETHNIDDEVLVCGGNDFQDGYLHALYMQRDWLQDMVTNFCD